LTWIEKGRRLCKVGPVWKKLYRRCMGLHVICSKGTVTSKGKGKGKGIKANSRYSKPLNVT